MALQATESRSLFAWRDYDETVAALRESMSLGSWALTGENRLSADELFASGARRVAIRPVVDAASADAADAVRALTLIRDLTACGIVVDWELRAGDGQDWRDLSHLYPPSSVTANRETGDGNPREEWARGYFMTKCVARRGPGLLQVRDRRFGGMRNITIARQNYLAAVTTLEYGAPVDEVPADILRELRALRLVGLAGDLAWWLPYRVRRYPVALRIM